LIFGENANKFMDEFSRDFHNGYLNTLKRRFGTKRVNANMVYQEYINDREHVHMNSTRWLTLADYVKWMGKKSICTAEETEKGWFITYIDRDPETLRRQEEIDKKRKLDLDDRQRQEMFLQKQIERAAEKNLEDGEGKTSGATELERSEKGEAIKISFTKKMKTSSSSSANNDFKEPLPVAKEREKSSIFSELESKKTPSVFGREKKKTNALDEIMGIEKAKEAKQHQKEEENKKRLSSSSTKIIQNDNWLHERIVVKIVTKKLGEKYFKKKGIVLEVMDDLYTGKIKLIESGTVMKLDQAHLETVLPALGKQVLILNRSAHVGESAMLDKINQEDFDADLTLLSGPNKGKVIRHIPYEDISKLSQE